MRDAPLTPWGLEFSRRVDSICDEFEEQWKTGDAPRIDDFLSDMAGRRRAVLRHYLELIDREYRVTADATVAQLGQYIGRYRIEKFLGQGGGGRVFLCSDPNVDRHVAIKVAHGPTILADTETFLSEARIAAQLSHPRIVGVLDCDQVDGQPYVVYQYVKGRPLSELIREHAIDISQSLECVASIAEALDHAHREGVIHRDVKPSNILIDMEGNPHLADFGLARLQTQDTITQTDGVVGTPAYMAPEQARGERTDEQSDIYSLGATLYELITGDRPFDGDQDVLLQKVIEQDPKPPRRLARSIPRDVEIVCLKAMRKQKRHRYKTSADFAEDLRRIQRREPIQARPVGLIAKMFLFCRRRPLSVALTAIAVLVVVGALIANPWSGSSLSSSDGSDGFQPPKTATQLVTLNTDPAGAQVVFIPLGKHDGSPQPHLSIDCGTSPIKQEIPVGEYLVVAFLDQAVFHEVFRRVPGRGTDVFPGFYPHQWFDRKDGMVQLRDIKLFSNEDVRENLVFVVGKVFAIGAEGSSDTPIHNRRIPGFYISPRLVTSGEFKELITLYPAIPDDEAVRELSWDEANTYCEAVGLRLPNEFEWEIAAKTTKGMFAAGYAEWTAERAEHYSRRSQGGASSSGMRIIRGLPKSQAYHGPSRSHHSATIRSFLEQPQRYTGVSFRCVRSLRPRLARDDFVRRVD